MNIVRAWKRYIVMSCSHSYKVHESAWRRLIEFKSQYDPHFTAHLGDEFDTAAFRSGAEGTADQCESPIGDSSVALEHIRELRPNVFLCGNHEDRLWKHMHSPRAIVADLAKTLVSAIEKTCAEVGAELVPYDGVWSGRTLGPALLTHGTVYNENAARDMAEMYPQFRAVFFGHTHTAQIAYARNASRGAGVNVGALTAARNHDYAKTRRKTLSWRVGWAYGEYCDDAITYSLYDYASEPIEFRPAKHQ